MFTSRLAVTVVAALLAGSSLCPAAAPPYVLRDADGDPLPLGAVARLGTLRLFHPVQVDFKAFTPDRRFLITAMYDSQRVFREAGLFHVWDLSTGRLVRRFGPDTTGTTHAVQSPEGRHIVSVGPAGIFLWEVPSGRLVRRLEDRREPGRNDHDDRCAFRDEKTLVAHRNNWVETMDLAGRRLGRVRVFEERDGIYVLSPLLSPDGKTIVTNWSEHIDVVDTVTGKPRGQLRRREGNATFHPGGKILAVAQGRPNEAIQIHDATTLRLLRQWKLREGSRYHPLFGPNCQFVPGGNLLATPGPKWTIDLWDWTTGAFVRPLDVPLGEPKELTFSLDGKLVASGAESGRIRVFDVATGKELLPFEGHRQPVHSVFFIDKDTLVSTAEWGGGSVTWDVRTGRVLRSLPEEYLSYRDVISPDGKVRARPYRDGTVLLLDGMTGKKLRLLGFSRTGPDDRRGGLLDPAVAFSPDGSVLAYADPYGPIRLWSVATGKERGRLGKADELMPVRCLTFSSDGSLLAAGGFRSNRVEVWDTATGKLVRQMNMPYRGHHVGFEAVAFTGDGRAVAALHRNGPVRLWEVSSGRQLFGWDPKDDRFNWLFPFATALACSPDGRLVASARSEGVILLWEVASGREVARFRSTGGREVRALAFSPDGRTLASGGEDMTILLWEVPDPARMPRR